MLICTKILIYNPGGGGGGREGGGREGGRRGRGGRGEGGGRGRERGGREREREGEGRGEREGEGERGGEGGEERGGGGERERERERGERRGVCAAGNRNLALVRQSALDALYLYLLQAGYTRSTFNSDTQTVVVVINTVRVSALNAHLVYEKHFRGPLAFGGPRQSPTFA